jgi:hypothetical protein
MKFIVRIVPTKEHATTEGGCVHVSKVPISNAEWDIKNAEHDILCQILYTESDTINEDTPLLFIANGGFQYMNWLNHPLQTEGLLQNAFNYRFSYFNAKQASINRVKDYYTAAFAALVLYKNPHENGCSYDNYLTAETELKLLMLNEEMYADESFPMTLSHNKGYFGCRITNFSILEKTEAGIFQPVDWKTYTPKNPNDFYLQLLFTLVCENGESTIIRQDILSKNIFEQQESLAGTECFSSSFEYPTWRYDAYDLERIILGLKHASWRAVGGNLSEILIKIAYFVSIDPEYSVDKLLGKSLFEDDRVPLNFGGVYTLEELPQNLSSWESEGWQTPQREISRHFYTVGIDDYPNIFLEYLQSEGFFLTKDQA